MVLFIYYLCIYLGSFFENQFRCLKNRYEIHSEKVKTEAKQFREKKNNAEKQKHLGLCTKFTLQCKMVNF